MPRTVQEPKQTYTIRLKPSTRRQIKDEAKKHGITEQSIFDKGIEMYIKYLNDKEV